VEKGVSIKGNASAGNEKEKTRDNEQEDGAE
jgi:hypothetical protein